MTDVRSPSHDSQFDPKRVLLLEAATQVFTRLGYRKTSMEEVARAAQVSRQGLYLHFSTKEQLFRAMVTHFFDRALEGVDKALSGANQPLSERLAHALDAWLGCAVEMHGGDIEDLFVACHTMLGSLIEERVTRCVERFEKALADSPDLIAAHTPLGVTPRDTAETVLALAIGLKHRCQTRAEFVERVTKAVRILCLPLKDTPRTVASS